MNHDKAVSLIENSFLKDLLKDENVTDISYNGVDVFYQHNDYGRAKFDQGVSFDEAFDFMRQLSNLSEQFFSTSSPILDISVGKYRINAVHPAIARVGNNKALTFSIRISSKNIRIKNDESFMPSSVDDLLKRIVNKKMSIVIAGLTGTGKTELQKYLLSNMRKNTRIIIIDNVLELDQVRSNNNLDISSWQFDERNSQISVSSLIKNALRSNPDWLIVAEARGQEMIDVLNSALTGIPIITTLHSESCETIISRMTSMVKMNEKKMEDSDIKKDIYSHIHFYLYIKKRVDEDGFIHRFISDLMYIDANGKSLKIYDYNDNIKQVKLTPSLMKVLGYTSKEAS